MSTHRIEVPGAMAEYSVNEHPADVWTCAVSMNYWCGDYCGLSYQAREFFTRQDAVEHFLTIARRHFKPRRMDHPKQVAAQQAMLERLQGGGLFGWVEPLAVATD